ncbi:helicase-associated domain-containing protein [Kitasatospora sp. NPDC058965]|uniref:helicase-associated domain-containing protein n=1 Tax=Kitasatospora sp. NPDC058965 TaxID=3346682 RepID=UPI0036B160C9
MCPILTAAQAEPEPAPPDLVGWLAGLDPDRLYRLLRARPDAAAEPAPHSLDELAERLLRPGSATAALRRLPLPCLQAAEALCALGGGPVPRSRLARLLDATAGERAAGLDTALTALAGQGLLWTGPGDRLHPNPTLRQVWPAPLGRPAPLADLLAGAGSAELRELLTVLRLPVPVARRDRLAELSALLGDPEAVADLLAGAPPAVRPLLLEGAGTAPAPLAVAEPAGLAAQWAHERGLLVRDPHGYGPSRVPGEVVLALRGPSWHPPFDPVPPLPELAPVSEAEVAREAAAAATAFTTRAAALLAACAAHPPTLLKGGGLGPRELGRLARTAHCAEPLVRLVLECALGAGLLLGGGRPDGRRTSHPPRTTGRPPDPAAEGGPLQLTAEYEDWRTRPPAEQYGALVVAWLTMPYTPTATVDPQGRPWPALLARPASPCCRHARRGLLTAAGRLPAGHGAAAAAGLGRLVAWHRPQAGRLPDQAWPFATVIAEAELLGVVARGTLSPLGAALAGYSAEQPGPLREAARELLPGATDRARIGADLTAVVAGPPSAGLAALLDAAAERETHGTASIWRFTAEGVRRALDGGRSPQQLTAELARAADLDRLPQPLAYLIADTARRHGRVKVLASGCVLHGDDPALLAELAAHRALAHLRLRRLAPTVLVSAAGPDRTLAALRAEGYAPAAEGADGLLLVDRPAPVPPPRGSAPARPARALPTGTALRRLAAQLLAAGPATTPATALPTLTEAELAAEAPRLSRPELTRLARALRLDQPVTVEYLTGHHTLAEHTVTTLALDPPYLHAHHRALPGRPTTPVTFELRRLHGVRPPPEARGG